MEIVKYFKLFIITTFIISSLTTVIHLYKINTTIYTKIEKSYNYEKYDSKDLLLLNNTNLAYINTASKNNIRFISFLLATTVILAGIYIGLVEKDESNKNKDFKIPENSFLFKSKKFSLSTKTFSLSLVLLGITFATIIIIFQNKIVINDHFTVSSDILGVINDLESNKLKEDYKEF